MTDNWATSDGIHYVSVGGLLFNIDLVVDGDDKRFVATCDYHGSKDQIETIDDDWCDSAEKLIDAKRLCSKHAGTIAQRLSAFAKAR